VLQGHDRIKTQPADCPDSAGVELHARRAQSAMEIRHHLPMDDGLAVSRYCARPVAKLMMELVDCRG
jgi:hypothetical protein